MRWLFLTFALFAHVHIVTEQLVLADALPHRRCIGGDPAACVGFAPYFSSSLRVLACSNAPRSGQKIWGASLANSQFFNPSVYMTEEEWVEKLGPERYQVMRQKGTERGFLGKYVTHDEVGIYHCAACSLPLFDSKDKYNAGAGWPTFTKSIAPKNVYYLEDYSFDFKRYEVLCRGCDCHLGHVFNDGPPPKGLRYCINSISLVFMSGQ